MKLYSIKKQDGTFEILRSKTKKAGYDPLPEQYTIADMPYIEVSEVTQLDELSGENVIVRQYNINSAAKQSDESERTKASQIEQKYNLMNEEIFTEMYNVFRTNRSDSATANYQTWEKMVQSPSLYSGVGLKVDHQLNDSNGVELFNPGSALDTDAKITSYASRKIEQALAYGVFRMQRIQQFKNEREVINNS